MTFAKVRVAALNAKGEPRAQEAGLAGAGEVRVALAALVRMIQLMGAEMLVGKYREDVDVFEANVRAKLFAHVEGVGPDATAAGVALAHGLVDPVLKQLRQRVGAMRAAEQAALSPPPAAPHRLN